jgi:SHS2 domain-containing protein
MEQPLPFIPFEPIDHTADLAFVARGRTPGELFTHAAHALVAFLYDRESVQPRDAERIELTAADPEELLVSWLQEILYRLEMRRRLYREFAIESIGPRQLAAAVRGEAFDPRRHEILASIKAATYHDLAIETELTPAGSLLSVRVVLDT